MKKGQYLVIAPVLAVIVLLVVVLGVVLANEPPRIISLEVETSEIMPLGSCRIVCHATDPDGNPEDLSYKWSASHGTLTGEGTTVTWTAPNSPGSYNITLVVTDSRGGTAKMSRAIMVVAQKPWGMEDLRITKDRYGHCYLKRSGEKYLVGQGQKYDIECVVTGIGAPVSYDWSCSGGQISGEGSMVTWTAPDTHGEVTITAVVTDIDGNVITKSIILDAVICSRCIFGC